MERVWGQFEHLEQTYGNTPWGKLLFNPDAQQHGQALPSGRPKSAASVVTSTLGVIRTLFVIAVTAIYLAIAPGFLRRRTGAASAARISAPAAADPVRFRTTLQRWLLAESIDSMWSVRWPGWGCNRRARLCRWRSERWRACSCRPIRRDCRPDCALLVTITVS